MTSRKINTKVANDKCQLETVLAKIHQAFEQLQDYKKREQVCDGEAEASFSSLTAMILQISQNSLASPMPRTMTTKKINSLKNKSMTLLTNVNASKSAIIALVFSLERNDDSALSFAHNDN